MLSCLSDKGKMFLCCNPQVMGVYAGSQSYFVHQLSVVAPEGRRRMGVNPERLNGNVDWKWKA